jgi:uncharacterized delta-60 repeat protein
MNAAHRTLILTVAAVGASLAPAGTAAAVPQTLARAPGRVAFSLDGGKVADSYDYGGESYPAVALPGGGVVAGVGGSAGVVDVVALQPDGAPDRSFGSDGIARVSAGFPRLTAEQVVRQPDGKLILVAAGTAIDSEQPPQLVLVRLDAGGSPDPSFGTGGVDRLPLTVSCPLCTSLALRPGGGSVVTGSPVADGLASPPQSQWLVAGLTPTGALDPSFGQSGYATLAGVAGLGSYGSQIAALPDGDIVTLGDGDTGGGRYGPELGRLLASGIPDPAFHGGSLEVLPGNTLTGGMLAYPDGAVVVDLQHALVRYTAAGLPDPSFGSGGIVQLDSPTLQLTGQLLPAPGDGALVVLQNPGVYGQDEVERIGPTGAVDQSLGGPYGLAFDTPFGGGESSALTSVAPRPLPGLDENTFAGAVLQRRDGSIVLLGGVSVTQPTGEGIGRSIDDFAAIALTPTFAPDPSFGGPTTRLRATLVIPRQRASTARTRHGIRVTFRVSVPGLARVVIRSGGRVVAQSVLPVFTGGSTTLPVELTSFGARWLKLHPESRLTAELEARDLLTSVVTADASGRLR